MKFRDKLFIAGLLAMASKDLGGANLMFGPAEYRIKGPKNKYNLTDEEKEQMSEMTPKQKKKFLKERK